MPKLEVAAIEALEQVNLHVAGMDVGTAQSFVCVPAQAVKSEQGNARLVCTCTKSLGDLVEWLKERGLATAVMETGWSEPDWPPSIRTEGLPATKQR